jgi:hypothetical protein
MQTLLHLLLLLLRHHLLILPCLAKQLLLRHLLQHPVHLQQLLRLQQPPLLRSQQLLPRGCLHVPSEMPSCAAAPAVALAPHGG